MNTKITIIIIILIVVLLIILIKPKATIAPVVNTPTPSASIAITPSQSVFPQTSFTLSEVAQHNNAKNCWIAISGKVYNATDFIASGQHNDKILQGCGIDATALFATIEKHTGKKAQAQLSKQLIGTIK